MVESMTNSICGGGGGGGDGDGRCLSCVVMYVAVVVDWRLLCLFVFESIFHNMLLVVIFIEERKGWSCNIKYTDVVFFVL